jgi:HEAT repeat protein
VSKSQSQSSGQPASTITVGEPQGGTIFDSIFSWTGALVVVVLAAIALFFTHRVKKNSGWEDEPVDSAVDDNESHSENAQAKTRELSGDRQSNYETKPEVKPAAPPPVSLYSAYRIDQEVRKLTLGQPYRAEVLSSRGSEDRRAILTSLSKIISAPETREDERLRARSTLETLGFVSRECAALLFSADPFDRTMAARTLGEIGSPASLPSLLEALHDSETIVRHQVLSSIGELQLASAIGPLIDAARNRNELPAGLVIRALAACSVEPVELLDSDAPAFASDLVSDSGIFNFAQLGQTEASIEELPETIEDESLNDALTKATSDDAELRCEAVKTLAQYPVKSAIRTLVSMAKHDQESMVRSLAVSSLGFIDHELVFPAVLIGMADESRDVRAAAARTLSRLSFDRTAAYGTLVRSADEQTLRDVAQACIKAGIVSQNIDRLASRDRRQAFEAFCLISLLSKAGLTVPVLEAIERHDNMKVRLSVIHLLASTGDDAVFEQLQQIAGNDELAEEIKIAALNEMYTIQQAGRREHERRNEAQLSRQESDQVTFLQTETNGDEVLT